MHTNTHAQKYVLTSTLLSFLKGLKEQVESLKIKIDEISQKFTETEEKVQPDKIIDSTIGKYGSNHLGSFSTTLAKSNHYNILLYC